MADLTNELEQNVGGLWEMGVSLPINNPTMESFEHYYTLSGDADVGANSITISDPAAPIKVNDLIFVGPSSNPTRNNDTLLYYAKYEKFLINNISISPGEISTYIITLKPTRHSSTSALQYSYLKGDPVTVRATATSWGYIDSNSFDNDTYPPSSIIYNGDFSYERKDAIDDFKGYSQSIKTKIALSTTTDIGILQEIRDNRRNILGRLDSKTVRLSSWVRASIVQDGTPAVGNEDSLVPYARAVFYSDPDYTNKVIDEVATAPEIITGTNNIMLNKTITLTEGLLSAKVGVYGRFPNNPRLPSIDYQIDSVVLEHCANTTKENEGYYRVDMNPAVGVNIKNKNAIGFTQTYLGVKHDNAKGDPTSRYVVSAKWKNRQGYFIDDMRVLEMWNKEGYPIVLRTKMPNELPNVLFCNIDIKSIKYIKGSGGNRTADINIVFEEINV